MPRAGRVVLASLLFCLGERGFCIDFEWVKWVPSRVRGEKREALNVVHLTVRNKPSKTREMLDWSGFSDCERVWNGSILDTTLELHGDYCYPPGN